MTNFYATTSKQEIIRVNHTERTQGNYRQPSNPTLLVAHLHFSNRTKPNKNAKELPSQRTTETEEHD